MRLLTTTLFAAGLLLPGMAEAGPKYSASTQKTSSAGEHKPSLAFDGLLSTSWAEDAPGQGTGEWLEVDLGRDVEVETVSIWGGDFSSMENWKGRSRVAEATLSWTGPDGSDDKEIELGDRFGRRDVKIGATIRTLKIQIDEVHEGGIFADVHIAEMAFDFGRKADPAYAEAIEAKISRS